MAEAMIEFQSVTKQYQGGQPAVDELTMSIDKGAITVFVGPSGCGKTTSLRMINRMVEPTSGIITVDGKDVTSVPAAELRRSMGYVMQSSGLMPHRSVLDNIATVPRLNGVAKAEARKRAQELLDVVGLASALGQAVPLPAVRRPAAARRRGPGARRRPARAAHGRALQRRGPRGPRRTAAGTPPAPAGPGQDHRLRHPRHRRGHRPRRQGGGVRRRRQTGPVRHAGGNPARPGQRLRWRPSWAATAGFRHLGFSPSDGVTIHPVPTLTRGDSGLR